MDCVFCRIRDGQIPSTRVYEDERTIAFMDINPLNEGHTLVIPRVHAATLFEADEADLRAAIDRLLEGRSDARARRAWAEADALRARLATLGVTVEDTPSGTTWKWRARPPGR